MVIFYSTVTVVDDGDVSVVIVIILIVTCITVWFLTTVMYRYKIFDLYCCFQAGRREPSENLGKAIDNMNKKTRDLRRQVPTEFIIDILLLLLIAFIGPLLLYISVNLFPHKQLKVHQR